MPMKLLRDLLFILLLILIAITVVYIGDPLK